MKKRETHGESYTAEYRTWQRMKNRCQNPNDPVHPYYGGRGIRVCDRWSSFSNFLADMGRRPSPGHSLDRIDNDGNYEPSNCRWATRSQQARNKRNNQTLEMDGQRDTITGWAERTGIPRMTITKRINRGWPIEAVLMTPVGVIQGGLRGLDRKTHCINGHEYTPENSGRNGRGYRLCLACAEMRSRARDWAHDYKRRQQRRKARAAQAKEK